MSAIAGVVHFHEEPIADDTVAAVMSALPSLRADDVRVWRGAPNAFLGCAALWATPESVGETMPLFDAERGLAIVADAIVDNRAELFEALQVPRERRASMPDGELILTAYAAWGVDTPSRLVGDFAFVVWDLRKRMLFGARDFSGTRTLYYSGDGRRFAFATTMRPLLALPCVGDRLNDGWIAEFLTIPVTADAVTGGETVYRDIRQIPPSHAIVATANGAALLNYRALSGVEPLRLPSDEAYEEAFRDVFRRAVSDRLRSRKPVGAQLSGGLDSGSVAAFAARELASSGRPLHTFSYVPVEGFESWLPRRQLPNERRQIESVVSFVGNIAPTFSDFADKDPLSVVDDWLETLEMPYKCFENSYWLQGVYEAAERQGVGTLLNGQRGNWTVSWGPAFDYLAELAKRLRWLQFYREWTAFSANYGASRRWVLSVVRRKAFPSGASEPLPLLIAPSFAARTGVLERVSESGVELRNRAQNHYDVRRHQFERTFYWGLNGTIGTKMSLKHGLWERDPTNDLRVVRFCLSVPEDQYVRGGYGRSLIRRATAGLLPDDVRLNQRTRGVQGADGVFRMTPAWSEFVAEADAALRDPDVAPFVNIGLLREALDRIRAEARPRYAYDTDFRLVMRFVIFRRFMKRRG